MKKVIWSPKAISSVEQLVKFIDNKWNRKVADKLLDEIDNNIMLISQNPAMFPLYSKNK